MKNELFHFLIVHDIWIIDVDSNFPNIFSLSSAWMGQNLLDEFESQDYLKYFFDHWSMFFNCFFKETLIVQIGWTLAIFCWQVVHVSCASLFFCRLQDRNFMAGYFLLLKNSGSLMVVKLHIINWYCMISATEHFYSPLIRNYTVRLFVNSC